MTNTLQKQLGQILLGSAIALGIGLTAPAGAEELRIGFLAPLTGGGAQVGRDLVDGFQFYLDEHGNKLGGADVKFIAEDEQGNPSTAVAKAKKLILNDNVNLFMGGWLASTAYALAPLSTAQKILYIASPAGDDLTQRLVGENPYFIRPLPYFIIANDVPHTICTVFRYTDNKTRTFIFEWRAQVFIKQDKCCFISPLAICPDAIESFLQPIETNLVGHCRCLESGFCICNHRCTITGSSGNNCKVASYFCFIACMTFQHNHTIANTFFHNRA